MQLMWLLIFLAAFAVLSFFDIRSHSIPGVGIAGVALLSVICFVIAGDEDAGILDLFFSCMPGIVLVALSFLTDDNIGKGDGLLIMCLGPALGLERIAYVLMGALIAGCIFCCILLLLRKAGRNTRIPFVPFITVGLGVMGCIFA